MTEGNYSKAEASSQVPVSAEATPQKAGSQRDLFARHLVADRQLVIFGPHAVVLQNPSRASRCEHRNDFVIDAMRDEDRLRSPRLEIGKVFFMDRAAHHDDAAGRLRGANTDVDRHQRTLREAAEHDLSRRRRIALRELAEKSQ